MNEKTMTIVTAQKGFGNRMQSILDKINFTNPEQGKEELRSYVYETWKSIAWNNEFFFIDISKGKRDRYEKSEDLAAMATAVAYKDAIGCMDGFGVDNSIIAKAFIPISDNGINVWNAALLNCRSMPAVRSNIQEFLVGEEIRSSYKKWMLLEKEKQSRAAEEARASTEAAKMNAFEEFNSGKGVIIDGEFKEVPFDEDKDKKEPVKDPTKDNAAAKEDTKAKKEEQKPAKNEEKKPDQKQHPSGKHEEQKKDKVVPKNKKEVKIPDVIHLGTTKSALADKDKPKEEVQVDPAEKEHPEDDQPVETDAIAGMDVKHLHGFPDMKQSILFEKNMKDEIAAARPETPFLANSEEYERFYPRVAGLTDMLAKEGYGIIYHLNSEVYPAAELLQCEIRKLDNPDRTICFLLVDPGKIYHNGYNVIEMPEMTDGKAANVLDNIFVPITDKVNIIKMIKHRNKPNQFSRKEKKSITKRYPAALRDIYDMVDFSTLKLKEDFKEAEWRKLCATLTLILDEQDIQHRVQFLSYMNPTQFTLIQTSKIRPVSRNVDDYAKILEEGQPEVVIDCNPKYNSDGWIDSAGNNKSNMYHLFHKGPDGTQVDDVVANK